MIKVGILGAAGYTGGELIRLLLNHPEVEIVFANSESNAGNKVYDVHEGLMGDTEMEFSSEMPFDKVDVVFFCFGHGKSRQFLSEHTIPENVKIIDLAQDFRIKGDHDYVYGLPEIHREEIAKCQHLANPGCFATCIQEGILPLAKAGLLTNDISVNAITGSTGAGQKPGATTHFSWRNNNFSTYKLISISMRFARHSMSFDRSLLHELLTHSTKALKQRESQLISSLIVVTLPEASSAQRQSSSTRQCLQRRSLLSTRTSSRMQPSLTTLTRLSTSSRW